MEKVPKKKARKGLNKRTGALLLLLLALAAGAGVYWLRRPAAPRLPETRMKPVLLNRAAEEIAAVSVAPAEGEDYTLIRQGADFRLEGREDMPLREDAVREILAVCADLKAEEAVLNTEETAVSLADFHLSPPDNRVTVTYGDGEKKTLLVGALTPEEIPQRYCMLAGDPRIYSVLSVETDAFSRAREALRAFTQPSLRGDLLDRVTVAGDGLDFDMRYTPSGWIMEKPFRYPLNRSRTDALLRSIEAMGFEACLASPGEGDLSAYGLDRPALTVNLEQAATTVTGETEEGQQVSIPVAGKTYTLQLGRETGKSGVYVLWEGGVYRASNFVLGFWKQLDPESLVQRQPVNFLVNDLKHVEFSACGRQAGYDVEMVESITQNNQIETDEYGRVLYDAAVTRRETGETADAEAFLSWYQRLCALTPAGQVPAGYAAAGEKTAEILAESNSITREIAFYPYDALHSAMAVDGVCLFYVENAALKALAEAMP